MPKSSLRKDWCEAAVRLINADPESVAAGQGWTGDFGVVVDAEPGKLERGTSSASCVPKDGRIEKLRVLDDPDDLDEFEPAYRGPGPVLGVEGAAARAPLDPVEAVLKRRHLGWREISSRSSSGCATRASRTGSSRAGDRVHRRREDRGGTAMGIGDELKKQALGMSQKAMEKLMADEKRAMQVAKAHRDRCSGASRRSTRARRS